MVGVNVPISVPMALHSFGGGKDLVFGDHATPGTEGANFYTRRKQPRPAGPTASEPIRASTFHRSARCGAHSS